MTTTVDVHQLRPDELDAVIDALTDRPAETHRRRAELQTWGRFRYLIAWIDGVPVGHVGLGRSTIAGSKTCVNGAGSPW